MATSNKIVDTRRLATKGRFGDTEIRNVRGKPSHVTALEAYYMDKTGVQPSASAKTINPITGLPEYHLWHDHGVHNTGKQIWDKTFGKEGLGGAIADIPKGLQYWPEGVKQEWEYYTPSGGTEWGGYGPSETKKLETQSKDIMAGGMENLQTQYEQYMVDEGFIEREQDIREEGLKSAYDISMGEYDIAGNKLSESTSASYKQLGDLSNLQMSKSNLAYSGTRAEKVREGERAIGKQYALGTESIELGKTEAQSTYDIGLEASALGAEKSEADFMGGLRKQLNQMLIDYQGATGEAYGGGALLTELNTLFDDYSENVDDYNRG